MAETEQQMSKRHQVNIETIKNTDDTGEFTKLAIERLEQLQLPLSLAEDESGQSSEAEHLHWLLTASDTEITRWAEDMGETSPL